MYLFTCCFGLNVMLRNICFTLFILLIACNNVEKHRDTITKLVAGWEDTNGKLATFAETISDEVAHWQSLYDGMHMDKALKFNLSAEIRTEANQLKKQCQGHGDMHRAIQQEVSTFLQSWLVQYNDIKALKEGLKKGRISDELIHKMEDLFSSVKIANVKLAAWQKQMQATKDECFETYRQYANLVQESKSGVITTAN